MMLSQVDLCFYEVHWADHRFMQVSHDDVTAPQHLIALASVPYCCQTFSIDTERDLPSLSLIMLECLKEEFDRKGRAKEHISLKTGPLC